MKKLFAILLAVAMIMSFALVASAEETTESTPLKAYLQYIDPTYQVGTFSTPSAELTNTVTLDKGTGTYTISWNMYEGYSATGIGYLYIEFTTPYQSFVDAGYQVSNVKLWVDDAEIALDQTKLSVWPDTMPTENQGFYCVELYVPLAATEKPMSAEDAAAFVCAKNITVQFDFTDPNAVEDDKNDEVEYEEVEVEVVTKLDDIDCTGWWTAHSTGVELTETPTTITFTNTTYATAANNWNTALWVLYTGNEAKVNGDGYLEYWVHRSDNFGWGNAGYYTAALPADTFLNTAFPDNLTANNIGWVGQFADGCWENWVADSQAGLDGTIVGYLDGNGNAVVSISYHGVTNTLTMPVDTTKPVYLSLTGELTKLTNITATTTEINLIPKTADNTNLIALAAAMVLSVAGVAVLVRKKEF